MRTCGSALDPHIKGRSQMRRAACGSVTREKPAFETMHPISVRQSVQPSLCDASYFRRGREPITGRARGQLRRYFCIQGRALKICALRWPMGRISDWICVACALCLQQGKTRRVERRCFGRRVGAFRCRCERQHALALRDDLSRFALQGAIHGRLRLDDLLAGGGEVGLRPGLLGVSVCPFGYWEVFSDASSVPDRVRALWKLRIDGDGGSRNCSRQREHCVLICPLEPEIRKLVETRSLWLPRRSRESCLPSCCSLPIRRSQTPQHATRRCPARPGNRRNRSTARRMKRAIPMRCT